MQGLYTCIFICTTCIWLPVVFLLAFLLLLGVEHFPNDVFVAQNACLSGHYGIQYQQIGTRSQMKL